MLEKWKQRVLHEVSYLKGIWCAFQECYESASGHYGIHLPSYKKKKYLANILIACMVGSFAIALFENPMGLSVGQEEATATELTAADGSTSEPVTQEEWKPKSKLDSDKIYTVSKPYSDLTDLENLDSDKRYQDLMEHFDTMLTDTVKGHKNKLVKRLGDACVFIVRLILWFVRAGIAIALSYVQRAFLVLTGVPGLFGIILGRVMSGGRHVSYFTFELSQGNPYGIVAASSYVVVRGIVLYVICLRFLANLASAAWSKADYQKLKDGITSTFFQILVLIAMPYMLKVVLYGRDCILFLVMNRMMGAYRASTTGASGLAGALAWLTGASDTIRLGVEQSKAFDVFKLPMACYNPFLVQAAMYEGSFLDLVLYVATEVVGFVLLFMYIGLALHTMILFVAFPAVLVMGKSAVLDWCKQVLANIATPVLDLIAFSFPLQFIVIASSSGTRLVWDAGNYVAVNLIILVFCFSYFAIRKKIRAAVHANSADNAEGLGAGSLLMGMQALRGLGGLVKSTAATAVGIGSDLSLAAGAGTAAGADQMLAESLINRHGGGAGKELSESLQTGEGLGLSTASVSEDAYHTRISPFDANTSDEDDLSSPVSPVPSIAGQDEEDADGQTSPVSPIPSVAGQDDDGSDQSSPVAPVVGQGDEEGQEEESVLDGGSSHATSELPGAEQDEEDSAGVSSANRQTSLEQAMADGTRQAEGYLQQLTTSAGHASAKYRANEQRMQELQARVASLRSANAGIQEAIGRAGGIRTDKGAQLQQRYLKNQSAITAAQSELQGLHAQQSALDQDLGSMRRLLGITSGNRGAILASELAMAQQLQQTATVANFDSPIMRGVLSNAQMAKFYRQRVRERLGVSAAGLALGASGAVVANTAGLMLPPMAKLGATSLAMSGASGLMRMPLFRPPTPPSYDPSMRVELGPMPTVPAMQDLMQHGRQAAESMEQVIELELQEQRDLSMLEEQTRQHQIHQMTQLTYEADMQRGATGDGAVFDLLARLDYEVIDGRASAIPVDQSLQTGIRALTQCLRVPFNADAGFSGVTRMDALASILIATDDECFLETHPDVTGRITPKLRMDHVDYFYHHIDRTTPEYRERLAANARRLIVRDGRKHLGCESVAGEDALEMAEHLRKDCEHVIELGWKGCCS